MANKSCFQSLKFSTILWYYTILWIRYILSQLFNMSAEEEEEHGYQAIIKALTKALTDIKGSPTDSLKPPTFDWNSSEQFEDFQLFIKGIESWYTLQGIPYKDGDTT